MQDYPALMSAAEKAEEESYQQFLVDLQNNFDAAIAGEKVLFRTDAKHLFDAFLAAVSPIRRQHYTCNACRQFIDNYAGLVYVNLQGETVPITCQPTSFPLLNDALHNVHVVVSKAKITGVFYAKSNVIGTPQTGPWNHMALHLPDRIVQHSKIKTAFQRSQEKTEDLKMLTRALHEYPLKLVIKAASLLESGAIPNNHRFVAQLKWFQEVHERQLEDIPAKNRRNLLWLYVALAPGGWCHVRSSVLGTLLEDIKAGKSFSTIKRGFTEKTDSINYQRPKAAPTEGNIDQAEKLIEELGLKPALERRLARFDELQYLWTPTPAREDASTGGVFDHLRKNKKAEEPVITEPVPITWVKFRDTILPQAAAMKITVPAVGPFGSFVTAANIDAPPLLLWDRPGQRNPISWYLYHPGSAASHWNLVPRREADCTGIAYLPCMWSLDHPPYEGVVFLLEGAQDTSAEMGLKLFPEIITRELHAVRSTIEAFSNNGLLVGGNEGGVGGLFFFKDQTWDCVCTIEANGVIMVYKIDRWD